MAKPFGVTDVPELRDETPREARTTAAILDATLNLIRVGGGRGVTTDAIAAEAGVSKASLYRRWRTRSEIIVAAAERFIVKVDIPDLGDFVEEVNFLLGRRLQQYSDPLAAAIFASLIGGSVEDDLVRGAFGGWIASQKAGTEEMIQRAIDRGELDTSWSTDYLATLIAAPLLFRLTVERRAPDQGQVDSIVQMIRCLVLAGKGLSI